MQISSRVCRFQPGSVNVGGTWQVAQRRLAVEDRLAARARRPRSKPPLAAAAPGAPAGRAAAAGSLDVIRSRLLRDVAEPGPARRRGTGARCLSAVVEEVAVPVHLEVRDERVPVRDRAPAGVRVEVHAGQPERGRDQRTAAVLPSGRKPLPSRNSSASNLPGPQRGEHLLDRRLVDLQQVGERLHVRRQRHDRADVEVAVRPAVEALSDPRARTSCRRSSGRRAHVMPIDVSRSLLGRSRCTPTTAFSFRSVERRLRDRSRFTLPALIAAAHAPAGSRRRRP